MKTQAELGFLAKRHAVWVAVGLQQLPALCDGSLGTEGDVVKRLVRELGCDPWATRSDIARAQDMRVAGNRDLQWSPSVAFME